MLAVFLGPTVVNCASAANGFGACINEKMIEVGLLAPAANTETPPVVATTEEQAATPAPEAETQAATTATDGTPAEPAAAATPGAEPVFGLLRAEPDGSMVIAGSGTPGTKIEVFSNGESIGTADVESSGDWVLVPETPIAPGGVELTVGVAGSDERNPQSYVVMIDPEKQAQPLVVASTPGQATDIIQGMTPPEPATQVAAVEPEATTPAEPASETATTEEPAAEAATSAEPAAEATTAQEPAASTETAAAPTEEPATETAAAMETTSAEPAASTETQTEVAAVEPGQTTPAPSTTLAIPAIPPTIDAIEIDAGKNFFAGGGPDGWTMRLYVDDQFISDAIVQGGRWLVEAGNVLTKPSQRVRIDMISDSDAKVVARAEVNFVVDLPTELEPGQPVQVAQGDQPAETLPEPQADAAADGAAATTEPATETTTAATEPSATAEQPATDMAATEPVTEAPVTETAATEPVTETASAEPSKEAAPAEEVAAAVPNPAPDSDAPEQAEPAEEPIVVADVPAETTAPVEQKEPTASTAETDVATTAEPRNESPSIVTLPAITDSGTSVTTSGEPAATTPAETTAATTAPAETAPTTEVATETAPVETTTDVAAAPAGDVELRPSIQPPEQTETAAAEPEATATEETAVAATAAPEAATEETDVVATEEAVPTMVAVASGDPEAMRFVSGKAIIRRGDNLWTIARRVYGKGVKYTSIYEANNQQIRDPDTIYPGQVFDLPKDEVPGSGG